MNTRTARNRVSGSMFGLIALGFFMTFATFSCSGQSMDVTGFDMLIGVDAGGESFEFGLMPLLAFGAALLGLAASFLRPTSGLLPSTSGLIGVFAMLMLRNRILEDVRREPVSVEFQSGFWIVLMLFLVAFGLNMAWWLYSRREASAATTPGSTLE